MFYGCGTDDDVDVRTDCGSGNATTCKWSWIGGNTKHAELSILRPDPAVPNSMKAYEHCTTLYRMYLGTMLNRDQVLTRILGKDGNGYSGSLIMDYSSEAKICKRERGAIRIKTFADVNRQCEIDITDSNNPKIWIPEETGEEPNVLPGNYDYIWLFLALMATEMDDSGNLYDSYDTFCMDSSGGDSPRVGTVLLAQLALLALQRLPCVRYRVPEAMRLPNYSYRYVLRKLIMCLEVSTNLGDVDCTALSTGAQGAEGGYICGVQVQTLLWDLHDLLRPGPEVNITTGMLQPTSMPAPRHAP